MSQIIIDSTDINLDFNWFKRKISKKMLENRDFKWGHSTHRGYFIGMKLTLALGYPSLKSLAFVVNEANVSEYTVFSQILEELHRRRKIIAREILYFDKGYYSYENHVIGIARYKIVPLIFQKINCNFKKLFSMLRYPLNIYYQINLPGKDEPVVNSGFTVAYCTILKEHYVGKVPTPTVSKTPPSSQAAKPSESTPAFTAIGTILLGILAFALFHR